MVQEQISIIWTTISSALLPTADKSIVGEMTDADLLNLHVIDTFHNIFSFVWCCIAHVLSYAEQRVAFSDLVMLVLYIQLLEHAVAVGDKLQ